MQPSLGRGKPLEVPEFYGDAPAAEFMAGVAAPLLAGAAVAITGVVVQQPDSLRWPGTTMLVLVVAASMLVAAVQFGFLARRHSASPSEIATWWPNLTEQQREERVRRDLADDAPLHAWWADIAGWAYGLGIIALWIGLGAAVAPDSDQAQPMMRWIAAVTAWGTALLELGWLVASRLKPSWFVPRRAALRHYVK